MNYLDEQTLEDIGEDRTIDELYEEIANNFTAIKDIDALYTLIKEKHSFLVCQDKWLYGNAFDWEEIWNRLSYLYAKDTGTIPHNMPYDAFVETYLSNDGWDINEGYTSSSGEPIDIREIISLEIESHSDGKRAFTSVDISHSEQCIDNDEEDYLGYTVAVFDVRVEQKKKEATERDAARRKNERTQKKKIRENKPIENIIDCTTETFPTVLGITLEDLPNVGVSKINVGKHQVVLDNTKNVAVIGKPTKNGRLIGKIECLRTASDILAALKV